MEPRSAVSYLLSHTASIMHRQSDQVLQERLGIGMSQYKILMLLQNQANVQQRALADALGQTEASISRQTKLLCDRGLLAVTVNPDSRREHITVLTPKGHKVIIAAREVLDTYHDPVFGALGEKQQQQLLEVLRKIHDQSCAAGKPHACDHTFAV